MFSEMKKEIIEAGILLDRYELVSLTCGNLSVRMPTGEIKQMSDAQIQQMVDVFQYYGQGTAKIPEDLVKRID